MEQRLTAIFAADMVGYSRLMEADEMGTIVRHKSNRSELIDPAIVRSGGRILKEMGDGILVEFKSIAGAVQCAIDIQKAMPAREAKLPAEKRISYRIGINLGDIVDDGNEVYGDGINVAARLEQMAEPGGICISGTAHDTLRAPSDVSYQPLGIISVKNINRPIQAYRVELFSSSSQDSRAAFAKPRAKRWEARWHITAIATAGFFFVLAAAIMSQVNIDEWLERSGHNVNNSPVVIALFPFRDLSDEAGSSYLSVGISEDLATQISDRAQLLLITPSTPATSELSLEETLQAAKRFGADYVLAGTVLQQGATSRVDLMLTSTATGATMLEKTYTRPVNTLAAIGEDLSVDVISAIPNLQLRPEKRLDPAYHFPDPAAYDFLLKGNVEFGRFNPSSLKAAEQLYRRAAEIDPNYARPLANMAFIYALQVAFGWSSEPEILVREAQALANAALQLDPKVHQAFLAKGLLARSQRQYQRAIADFEKAIEIAPNSADAYAMIALTQVFSGDPEGGLASIEKAIERNPDHPFFYLYTKGMALFHQEQFEAAADYFRQALARNPEFLAARLAYVSALSYLGQTDEAQWELEEVLVRQPEFSLLREQVRAPYADTNDTLRYIGGLKAVAESQ